jgi:hypothetical protein
MTSEQEKEKLREEARVLLESFAKKLEKVDLKKGKSEKVLKESGMREEGKGKETDSDFKKRFFDNVPEGRVKNNKIVAEKKKW